MDEHVRGDCDHDLYKFTLSGGSIGEPPPPPLPCKRHPPQDEDGGNDGNHLLGMASRYHVGNNYRDDSYMASVAAPMRTTTGHGVVGVVVGVIVVVDLGSSQTLR